MSQKNGMASKTSFARNLSFSVRFHSIRNYDRFVLIYSLLKRFFNFEMISVSFDRTLINVIILTFKINYFGFF